MHEISTWFRAALWLLLLGQPFWRPLAAEIKPRVFVAESLVNVKEGSPSSSSFQLVRTGSSPTPLVVHYSVTGTAMAGTDYEPFSGTAVIPGNSERIDLPLRLKDNAYHQSVRTVNLWLEKSPDYDLGYPYEGLVKIGDNDTNHAPTVIITRYPEMPIANRPGDQFLLPVRVLASDRDEPGGDFIQTVELFLDGKLVSAVTNGWPRNVDESFRLTMPYTNGLVGTLVARATDSFGLSATSAPIRFKNPANSQFTVEMVSPKAGSEVTASSGLVVDLLLTGLLDQAGLMVSLFDAEKLIYQAAYTGPLSRSGNHVTLSLGATSIGEHRFKARVNVANGGEAESQAVAFTVRPPVTPAPNPRVVYIYTAAVNPLAYEGSGTPAELQFFRSGSVSNALTVNLALSGTAVKGQDYLPIATNLTFLAGSATANLQVRALENRRAQTERTLQVRVAQSTGYVGMENGVTIRIRDAVPAFDNSIAPIQITDPPNFSSVALGGQVRFRTTIRAGFEFSRVRYFVDGVQMITSEHPPFDYAWSQYSLGRHEIHVIGETAVGGLFLSDSIYLDVSATNQRPNLIVLAPREGDFIAPSPPSGANPAYRVSVNLVATDADGSIKRVTIVVNNRTTLTLTNAAGGNVFATNVLISVGPEALTTLRINAYDDANQVSEGVLRHVYIEPAYGNLMTVKADVPVVGVPRKVNPLPKSGNFVFTRQEVVNQTPGLPLVVSYTIGGTALPGFDYNELSGTVVFSPNQTEAKVSITPLVASLLGQLKTVSVALKRSTAYRVGEPGVATIQLDGRVTDSIVPPFLQAVVQPYVLSISQQPDGSTTVNVEADADQEVVIEGSANLSDWTVLSTLPAGSATRTFVDADSAEHRFYRARTNPGSTPQ